jgi:3'(2'), 5'-bisphosphate nucleotidase
MSFLQKILAQKSEFLDLIFEANHRIMHYFNSFDTSDGTDFKADNSPVTKADIALSSFLKEGLLRLTPNIPVISEEDDVQHSLSTMRGAELFWLIDPIDGTWSFIRRRGHFVVNVALIHAGAPVLGMIGAPQEGYVYFGDVAHKQCVRHGINGISKQMQGLAKLPTEFRFLVSSMNMNEATSAFIARYNVLEVRPIASAYKYALMVEHQGHIHPRFGITCAWDTAAGHALLNAVGGGIYDTSGHEMKYNQQIENPHFIAMLDSSMMA